MDVKSLDYYADEFEEDYHKLKLKSRPIKMIFMIIGIGVILFFSLIYFGVSKIFAPPEGELIVQNSSPNKEYTIKAYLVDGGMTVDYAVRVKLINNVEKSKVRTIYWNYHESKAIVEWLDNENVNINGHILNVKTDSYDWRNQ